MWACGLDRAGPGQRQVADACECGNEPSGSVKCGEFLDQLQTGQLLRKDSAPWSEYLSTFNKSRRPERVFIKIFTENFRENMSLGSVVAVIGKTKLNLTAYVAEGQEKPLMLI